MSIPLEDMVGPLVAGLRTRTEAVGMDDAQVAVAIAALGNRRGRGMESTGEYRDELVALARMIVSAIEEVRWEEEK